MEPLQYGRLTQTVTALYRSSPFLEVRVFGRSVTGRGLFALHLGSKTNAVFIGAGLDGSETQAPAVLLTWIATLCDVLRQDGALCGVALSRALRETGVTVAPCLNPDGMEITACGTRGAGRLRRFAETLAEPGEPWRANACGVELCRQFPAGFATVQEQQAAAGKTAPAAQGFFGTSPGSEPESRALVRLCRGTPFRSAMLLGESENLLTTFAPSAPHETVLATKILSSCAGVPFLAAQEERDSGSFPVWFAQTFLLPAFSLNIAEPADRLYRRVEEALLLFTML